MSNLYVGKKCIGASWKPLKIEPGREKKHILSVRVNQTQQKLPFKNLLNHTILHFLGELVMLHQRAHIISHCAVYDVFHFNTIFTQPKVKISKPEDLVKSCGDVSWKK